MRTNIARWHLLELSPDDRAKLEELAHEIDSEPDADCADEQRGERKHPKPDQNGDVVIARKGH